MHLSVCVRRDKQKRNSGLHSLPCMPYRFPLSCKILLLSAELSGDTAVTTANILCCVDRSSGNEKH